jgi:hypothetical protein
VPQIVTKGLRVAVISAAATALAVGVLTTATAQAQPTQARMPIAGTQPAWATSARQMSQAVTS